MAVLLLSVHPLLDQSLPHLHPTHMTDLPTYLPLPQLVIVLTFKSEHLLHDSLSKGWWGACPSASFPGNQWANLRSVLPVTDYPFPPPPSKHCCRVICTQWRAAPGPCFRHVSSPCPLSHWRLCRPDSGLLLRSWSWASTGLAGLHAAAQHFVSYFALGDPLLIQTIPTCRQAKVPSHCHVILPRHFGI